MITFGRKLKHLRQKNHLTQKELGIAMGFPEMQFTASSGRHSVLERPFSETNGRPFFS